MAAVTLGEITIGPGEHASIMLDFSAYARAPNHPEQRAHAVFGEE
jgi:hypothetical protein